MALGNLQCAEGEAGVPVTSRGDLEAKLAEFAREPSPHPVLAILSMPNGGSAYIGLRGADSVVFLHDPPGADGLIRQWIPVVDESREGFTAFFLLGQHHSEFENRTLMPAEQAIRIAAEYYESGLPPSWIRWEENSF